MKFFASFTVVCLYAMSLVEGAQQPKATERLSNEKLTAIVADVEGLKALFGMAAGTPIVMIPFVVRTAIDTATIKRDLADVKEGLLAANIIPEIERQQESYTEKIKQLATTVTEKIHSGINMPKGTRRLRK